MRLNARRLARKIIRLNAYTCKYCVFVILRPNIHQTTYVTESVHGEFDRWWFSIRFVFCRWCRLVISEIFFHANMFFALRAGRQCARCFLKTENGQRRMYFHAMCHVTRTHYSCTFFELEYLDRVFFSNGRRFCSFFNEKLKLG